MGIWTKLICVKALPRDLTDDERDQSGETIIMDIRLTSQLWANRIFPEGAVEHWRVPNGAHVEADQVIADIRIEEALHALLAPTSGQLVAFAGENDVIEPDSLIGWIEADR
jgi:hypothetical protein